MIDQKIRNSMEKIICHQLKASSGIKNDNGCLKSPIRVGKGDGNSILLCGRRKTYFPFHCFVGPDWPMLLLVYCLILSINLVLLPILSYLGYPVVIIGSLGFVSLMYFYSAVACSDPGIVFDEDNDRSSEDAELNKNAFKHSPSTNTDGDTTLEVDLHNTATQSHTSVSSSDQNNTYSALANTNVDSNDNIMSSAVDSKTLLRQQHPNITMGSIASSTNPISNQTQGLVVQGTVVGLHERKITTNTTDSTDIKLKRGANGSKPTYIECGICEIDRPSSARHCFHCGVCIEELDHHCPWCGKCIGKKNMFFFKAFLTSLCFQCYFLIATLIYYLITVSTRATPVGPSAYLRGSS